MPSPLRLLRITLLSLVAALLVVLALGWLVGDRVLRGVLERELQARLVPEARIEGPVGWRVIPAPALLVRGLQLVDGAGMTVLAVRELTVALDAGALADGRIVLSSLALSGVDARVHRAADGGWDFNHWLKAERAPEPGSPPAPVQIAKLSIEGARIHINGGFDATLDELDLQAGPVAPGVPGSLVLRGRIDMREPLAAAVQVELESGYAFDTDALRLDAPRLALAGHVGSWTLEQAEAGAGAVSLLEGQIRAEALDGGVSLHSTAGDGRIGFSLASLAGAGAHWQGETLALDVEAAREGGSISARLAAANLATDEQGWRLPQFELDLAAAGDLPPVRLDAAGEVMGIFGESGARISSSLLKGRAELPHPAGGEAPLMLSFSGSAQFDAEPQGVMGNVTGSFDASRFAGNWAVNPQALPPVSIDLWLDRLDLDTYLPPPRDESAAIDLASWRHWPVKATLRVDALQLQGFQSRDARLMLVGGAQDR